MRDKSGKRNLLLAAAIVGLGISASMNPAHADDLWDAINNAASSGYTLNDNYTLPDGKSSLGDLKSSNFTLEGNNKSIELNKKSGVSIDDDKSMTIRNAIIKNAKNSAEGGAIYNEGKLEITGSQFNDDHADDDDAGAIWNEGTISKILADFNNNGATDNGGAIYNKGTITTISGNFIGNRAEDDGGAIYNKGTISSISGKFNSNTSGDDGGAICNKSGATINEINATFWGNQLINDQGGAIYNDGTIGSIKGSFSDNWVLDYNKHAPVSAGKNKGGAIYNDGKITSIDADFTNNRAIGFPGRGGAIYNEGTIDSINGNFKGNYNLSRTGPPLAYVYGGGAIFNDDTIGSITGTFTENSTVSDHTAQLELDGGAIQNSGKITSINADFYRNSTVTNGGAIHNWKDCYIGSITGTFEGNIAEPEEWKYIHHEEEGGLDWGGKGGAIFNLGTIDSISGKFINNKALYYIGGAIQNHVTSEHHGTIKSINADFIGNSAFYAGGAIANINKGNAPVSFIGTITGNFINNWVYGTYKPKAVVWVDKGGAIYNDRGVIEKISGYFEGNSSEGQGGAIWYDDYITATEPLIISASFKNNYADDKGGAIYHEDGNIIITTEDNTDTIFSSNKQGTTPTRDDKGNIISVFGGESNAIYNNDYVEFSPKEGRTIWMYDSLADSGDNAGWEWVKTGKGTLALGEDMSEVTGDVWIKEGTIKLVQNDRNQYTYGTGFYAADEVKYENNVYIDSQDNHIGDFHLGKDDITLNGTLHSLIDVDLDLPEGDKIIAGGNISGSGSIVIDSINVVTGGSTSEYPKNVLIADDYTKGKISLGSNIKITGEGYKGLILGYTPTSGILNIKRGLTLKEVTNATDPESRVFSAPDDEVLTDNIGNIGNGNANLVVNMNNHTINGKKDDTYHSGFVTTAGDQMLTINDAEVINFLKNPNGSFIYDEYGAEININNSTIKNNEATDGGVIYSIGNLLTLTDSNIMDNKISGTGGVIYSKGNVTVNAINNEVQFVGNYDDSTSAANAIYMEGTAGNPITLTLNSKDSTHAVSIGDKLDGSYYNIVINDAEDSLGEILFGNSVNTGSLTVSKGVLENNGTVTVTSGTNNGTISYDSTLGMKGDFILDDGGASLVFNNNGSFTQNSLTIKSGEFKTDSSNLHISSDIVNDGTLVFNNTTNGSIDQNIKGSTSSSDGIVEIAASDKVKVDLNGYTITDNDVKLTSGIFDVTSNADNDGNINISSMGLVANGGTLNLQDNKAGNINLGNIKTSDDKNLNVAIDMHFVTDTVNPAILNEHADIISANSLTGNGKIHVSDIKMSKDDSAEPVTPTSIPMAVQVATGAAAIENMDFTGTTITNINKTYSSVMLTYDSGWLTVSSTTPSLEKAIISYVSTKLYAMSGDETIDDLVLNGDHLAVTTNGADILSTSGDNSTDGIHIADGEETLTFYGKLDESGNPKTKISGFKTAIDNLAGGEVHLENIEMSGNTTDVLNAGKLNLDGKNIVNAIADYSVEPMGSTNIVGGTSTIGSIVQKAVNILPDAELNIRADKLSATDGVDNWGTLNLGSGDLASNIFETQQDTKQGVINIVGDVTNTSGKTIAQKSVTIANSASLTTGADKVTADDGISNEGTLNLTGGRLASSISGVGTTNIKGDVTNLSIKEITQKEIIIDNTASLTSYADSLIATNGISNAGTLTLTGGELGSAVTGAGTTNIEGNISFADTTITISQAVNIAETGNLTAETTNLTGTSITNDGTLTFNNAANGLIAQNISGSDTDSKGIVEISAADNITIGLNNGKTITNNNVKLTSGIFDVTSIAENNGDINLSSMGLVANGGTLNLQDNKAGSITLGDITAGTDEDAKNLNVAIDMHFVTDTVDPTIVNGYADKISVNSLTGDGKIHVSDIKMSKDEETGSVTPPATLVQVATGAAAIENMDFTGTTISNIAEDISVFLTYDNDKDSATGGYLNVSSSSATLKNAIISSANVKLYAMSGDETIDDLGLNGYQLAVTTNGANISSTSGDDGIHIADTEQTLSFYGTLDESGNPETKISGFKTAINNLAGGEVHLENIKMSGNTTDVLNAGNLNLDGKNIIDTIADDITDLTGITNIVGGSSTVGSIVQKTVNILPGGELNINADKLSASDGVDNWGTLNLGSGDLASNIFETQDPKLSTTNIVGDVTNTSGKTIEQKSVTIADTASLTTDADKVTADDRISNEGTLNLTGGNLASAVYGYGNTNIKGDVTNTSDKTISQKSVTIDSSASLTTGADNVTTADGISNAGNLNLTGGDLTSSVNGDGNTNIAGDVKVNGKNIVQTNLNIGHNGTGAATGKLTSNDDIINAANINVTESGTLEVNATSGQILTSDLLKDKAGTGTANITTASGGTVAVNTNSIVMVVDNNVSGTGALTLTGNAGSSKSSSNVGTEFYVSPNAVVSSAINLAAGQLNTGDASNITGAISVASDSTLNAINGGYSTFNNTTFADGAQLKADVSAMSNKSDNFISPNEPTGGNEYLTDLNIQDMYKIAQNSKSINLSQTIGLNNLQPTDDLVANLNAKYSNILTPIRKMNANVQMTPEGLMLNFVGTGNKYKDFNPAVMASPVAAQMGGYLTQLNSYDEAFRNMDMYMLMTASQRQALKYKNKIASLDGGVLYDKTLLRQERAEGWFRPYATFEKVGLKNGPKVENQAYGTFVGGDSKMYDLGHGWDGMWGAYVGYNGSHQNYDGVSIYQNGGTLGLTGMAYKGNFFTGLTINAGASAAEASTMYGHEDLTMLMAGIASKTGYNWELANGKFIIQPSWLMSYSFVNTFDYTNAAGVRMHSSPLNAIQLQPELKFIGNLKNGWQPYASVAMVWNIMDDTKFKANDVSLPELSVKPYVKYGVGVRKSWGERFTGFFQTYLTNGGRNGVGLQAGFTWALGGGKDKKADEQKIQKSLKKAPELKKTEITLNDSNA